MSIETDKCHEERKPYNCISWDEYKRQICELKIM